MSSMTVRPEDLRGDNKKLFDAWRSIGLSEEAALSSMRDAGWLPMSEDEKLARRFQNIFGLSEAAAKTAAGDRGVSRPVSESQAARQAEDRRRLVAVIEAWAAGFREHGPLCVERGESEELASLRAAYGKVLLEARNEAEAAFVIGVVGSWRPELLHSSGTQTRSVGEATRQPGRRTVSGS
jgi:hypothetical protein